MAHTFDFAGVFDADYVYFSEERQTPERNEREAEVIWSTLQIEPGMEVLDLACGYGRIANRLARLGAHVTGLDANPTYLEMAHREAESLGVEVAYVEGDMRALPWTDRFDRIVNWYTSSGYFSDRENRQVLAEACHALRPGGRLLIEQTSLYRQLQHLQADAVVERDGDLLVDRRSFNPLTSCIDTERIVVRGGQVRRTYFAVRVFSPPEIRDWLLDAGFEAVDILGPDGQPLTLDSPRMLVVAYR